MGSTETISIPGICHGVPGGELTCIMLTVGFFMLSIRDSHTDRSTFQETPANGIAYGGLIKYGQAEVLFKALVECLHQQLKIHCKSDLYARSNLFPSIPW